MKKNMIPAIVITIISVLIIIGSQTFLAPCIHEDGSYGSCHWAGQAILGLGCVLTVLGILALCVKRTRSGIFLGILPVSIVGILTPGTLIALCRMSTMHCRMVMQPAMIILFSAVLLCSVIGLISTVRK